MIRQLLCFFCCSIGLGVLAQVTNLDTPASWDMMNEKSILTEISLPEINIDVVKEQDNVNDKLRSKPYRIGIPIDVSYGLDTGGTWTQLPNGDRIWRIVFSSKDALHLSVNFDSFFLPEGAKIYLYNGDKSDLLGAYTDTQNNDKEVLGTWFVNGSKVCIEYYEPKEVHGEGRLNLSSIIHGYRLGNNYQKGYFKDKVDEKINNSGDCNHDVECPIGTDYESKKDLLKKSVVFLNMGDGFICSGALINNSSLDKTPYFLTADHCFERNAGGSADPALFSMRFNWISPDPVCAATTDSSDATTNMTMSVSTLRARNAGSDVALVELNSAIPDDWDVTFAGWDRSDASPTFQVGMHHPNGDIMKVCRDNDAATKETQFGVQTWDINGLTNTGNSGNTTGWEIGVTEGGSSGSPLFDQNGRIIGQLLGGLAGCSGTNDNNAHDYYGRFAISWDAGANAESRLIDWLDPIGSNPNTLDAIENLEIIGPGLEKSITLFPNPTSSNLRIKTTGMIGELRYEVYNFLGQRLRSNTISNDVIDLSNLADNIYIIRVEETSSNLSVVKKIVLSK